MSEIFFYHLHFLPIHLLIYVSTPYFYLLFTTTIYFTYNNYQNIYNYLYNILTIITNLGYYYGFRFNRVKQKE